MPPPFVEFLLALLSNRTSRIRINWTTGRRHTSKEALQDSLLPPLLLSLIIKSSLVRIDDMTHVSDYADDFALDWAGRHKEAVAHVLKLWFDKVVERSEDERLTLSSAMCEIAIFSQASTESSWRPNITIDVVQL